MICLKFIKMLKKLKQLSTASACLPKILGKPKGKCFLKFGMFDFQDQTMLKKHFVNWKVGWKSFGTLFVRGGVNYPFYD